LPLHAAFLIEPVPQKLDTEFGDLGLELGAQFLSLSSASTSPKTSTGSPELILPAGERRMLPVLRPIVPSQAEH
jgi:hypothetical protein